jgi:2-methylcitrate dehydratase PrpD
MTKPFHVGNAARTAIVSVSLARHGLTSDGAIFDGDGGVLPTYGGGASSAGPAAIPAIAPSPRSTP